MKNVRDGKAMKRYFQLSSAIVLLGATIASAPAYAKEKDGEDVVRYRAPWSGEVLGTGATRPTQEQWAWGEKHLVKAKKVKPNKLGFSRINEARRKHGARALNEVEAEVVPEGFEVSAVIGDASTPDSGDGAMSVSPSYVDNSTLPYFPPIRSQGSLGSCAQFAAVYYTLTHMTSMARGWDAKTGGDSYRFSPKWTYNMLNRGVDAGSWHYSAYAIARKHGLATWAEFPYDSDYREWSLNPAVWRNAINVRADRCGKVTALNTDAGLTQLKQLLADGYVLNFATYIGSWQWKIIGDDLTTTSDDSFVGGYCASMVDGDGGAHTMTIVGFSDDIWIDVNADGIVTPDEKGALRIANSWGSTWGDKGFCWVAYKALVTRNPRYAVEGIFWYDEATWVTAKAEYEPLMVAEFTVAHSSRNQLLMTLGLSDTSVTAPSTSWSPNSVLSYAGGAYSFGGDLTPCDGTFYLDVSDLVTVEGGTKRYYLGMTDNATGSEAILKSFKLMDVAHGREVSCDGIPRYADGEQEQAYVDYAFETPNIEPLAVAIATPDTGYVGMSVTLDGSGSRDFDGAITTYSWDFGDGATGNGVTVEHIYVQSGCYTATLTVTDGDGAEDSTAVIITVISAEYVAAPSDLTFAALQAAPVKGGEAPAAANVITLRWADNADNETGFCIERGTKVKNVIVYNRAGCVGSDVTNFCETVSKGTYYYRVQAYNSFSGTMSDYSNTVKVRVK